MNEPNLVADQNQWKQAAAEAASKIVESGMVVGLGSGSTAKLFVDALGRRVAQEGLKIVGLPLQKPPRRKPARSIFRSPHSPIASRLT